MTRRCDSCGHAFEVGTERCEACGNPLPRLATTVPDEELVGAYKLWERLHILAPSFGNDAEILTLAKWHVAPGDVVEAGEPLAAIQRADGFTHDQEATDRARVLECLVAEGAFMQPKAPMIVLGPVTPEGDRLSNPVQVKSGCAIAALALVGLLAFAWSSPGG